MTADPDAPDDIPPWDLSDLIEMSETYRFSVRFYQLALDDVSSREMVEKTGVLPDHMSITDTGIRYVETQLDNSESFIFSLQQNRDSGLQTNVPASDRYVALDHNQTEYKEALNAMDELLNSIKQSNSYPGDDILDCKAPLLWAIS